MQHRDAIIAPATAPGMGAIAVIRLSGGGIFERVDRFFWGKVSVGEQRSHTVQLGYLKAGTQVVDEVLLTVFRAPHSYTGEDVAELSCHGSVYVQRQVLELFLRNGLRMADAGEFTLRAFLNGKMDLSQAEAVADLIASKSAAAHRVAWRQMRGGFSAEIKRLRAELIHFASLIELELDFSGEDVAFADRKALEQLLQKIEAAVKKLLDSFALGNVLKNGIPVAIIGAPNVGKSTLLNTLLHEARAIVSGMPGTTRDSIEVEWVLAGVTYRLIDTAGIRKTTDEIESIGIQNTYTQIEGAQLIILLLDATGDMDSQLQSTRELNPLLKDKTVIQLINKIDAKPAIAEEPLPDTPYPTLLISAQTGAGIDALKAALSERANTMELGDTVVSNSRHYAALQGAWESLKRTREGLQTGLSGDWIAQDIRQALLHLGEITGEVATDDLLSHIFAHFCVGK
ncbi:MAG: tRNA uridine-5-carboxymethylaminomethyl(34) synthesis GTPase MnmE [Flavobacteriales bacterium]